MSGEYVEIDRAKMTGTAEQHKKMPDSMAQPQPLCDKKEDSRGIEDAAGHKPNDGMEGQIGQQRFDNNNRCPSHQYIKNSRKHRQTVHEQTFQNDATQS